MVQLNFDANTVAPNAGFEPLPEGWYNVAITESEVKPTKDGEGAYLQLKATVIDGPHASKFVNIRLNIQNKNQRAVNSAYGELSAICHVTGVLAVQDSSQLHNIPFQVKVAVRSNKDADGNVQQSNDVKAYKDSAGNEPGKRGQAPQGGPQNFGGQQPQGAPQGQQGQWGGNPAQGQPQQQPVQNTGPQGGGWGGPQGTTGGAWGQQQPDHGQQPPAGQQQPWGGQNGAPQGQPNPGQGGAPWGGGQPAQGAAQPNHNPQGNGGWQQQPQGAPQGGAPWGQQG